jgi:hypothetical protein
MALKDALRRGALIWQRVKDNHTKLPSKQQQTEIQTLKHRIAKKKCSITDTFVHNWTDGNYQP